MLLCASIAHGERIPIPHGSLELIAENQWIAAGRHFDVGLRFELEKGWHIYWINPGDSGEPLRVEWRLPPGFTAGQIEWPTPRRLQTSSIVDYGYENTVLLIVPMHAGASTATQQAAHLNASVKLLVCSQEMCIPGKAELSLTLPIKSQASAQHAQTSDDPALDAGKADLFSATRKSLPLPAPAGWRFSVADAKDSFVLTANLGHQVTQAVFFPLVELQIENATPQKLVPAPTGFRMTLRKSDQLQRPIERLKGVLVLSADSSHADPSGADQSYAIDVRIGKTAR